jgi:hypothetical protein
LLCSTCVVSTSKEHSFRLETSKLSEEKLSEEQREQVTAQLASLVNSRKEATSDQDGNDVSESNNCGRPGLDQGLTGGFQIYDANRRTVEFAIKASVERAERLRKLTLLVNSSNETKSQEDNNVVSESNHCGQPGLEQALIDADFTHDPGAAKICARQIYDSNRRTVEFAITASVEREERLKKLVRAGNALCHGSMPKPRTGFVADASYNSTHASTAYAAKKDKSKKATSNIKDDAVLAFNNVIEDNPVLEHEPLTCPKCGTTAMSSARYCRCCSHKLTSA